MWWRWDDQTENEMVLWTAPWDEIQADALKGAFLLICRSIEPILYVKREIKHKIDCVKGEVEKSIAIAQAEGVYANITAYCEGQQNFNLIMTLYQGKEPDYTARYVKTTS